MDHLFLHEGLQQQLTTLAKAPPHALLLLGPSGIGKQTLATAWANKVTQSSSDIRLVEPDEKGTITIEVVRQLYQAARTKQAGHQVIIIADADHMSLEAENAFLKLLEEPRAGLSFVLTALGQEALLPTVLSRVQRFVLQPLNAESMRRLIVAKQPAISQTDLSQLLFVANGRPGVALRLLADKQALPAARERMQQIKQLLVAKPYERFLAINQLAANREDCLLHLQAMARIVEVQLTSASSKKQTQHWLQVAQALEEALRAITNNGNLRAQLLKLFSAY